MPAKTEFRPALVEQARNYCLLGATDEQLAEFFGVTSRTIRTWKRKHADFAEAVEQGKKAADVQIVGSLFHRAKGYSHPEVDIRVIRGKVVQTPIVKHYAPDTVACIFWLKNRDPDNWRDRISNEHSGPNGGPIESKQQIVRLRMTPVEELPE
jgi:hypothetical protein